MSAEQDGVQKEKAQILRQLQRTTSDMEDVKEQLNKFKDENHSLERELLGTALDSLTFVQSH
jgi:predicted nuclease with TOPRIM domain